ncbi:hypothetical protein TH53_01015 [Pedobacter lusitanus]|uniref:Beta-galactosidase n=1 Tax=Pedobacter lusitanus TaxID=1503925 RepID=A0A0D0GNW6_9SPHI|nr:hypothetical protein TH53_01015 [Pedobacter lusitanus]
MASILSGFSNSYAQSKLISLNEQWKFSKDQTSAEKPSSGLNWQNLSIPHTWNAEDVIDDTPGYYRGTGWYKRKLKLDVSLKNKEVFLVFYGVNQEAEVYVNGKSAGKHIGGYTGFTVPVSRLLNHQDDEIQVRVTNQFNEDIAPLTADFTFFGGIYRNVDLLITEPVHFARNDHGSNPGIYMTTPEVSEGKARVQVKSLIENASAAAEKVQVQNELIDQQGLVIATAFTDLVIPAGQTITAVQEFKNISSPHLWSPENPYLYRIISKIITRKTNRTLDQVSSPLGFRWFRFDAEKGFFLNGQPLKLIGASRHQDYMGMGNAVPDVLQLRDVELLKKMGGNFLRVAHYPQDPQILEACDRLGILASVEIPVVNTITESAAFTQNCKQMQQEMIRQNFNHPSVVIWAYMNEILLRPKFADDKIRQAVYFKHIVELAQTLDSLTRKEDPSRYTMIANHGAFDSYHKIGLTKIPMIVGWNLYSGWYSGNIADFGQFLDRHHQELADKPMLVTEYGADADPRIRSFSPVRFDKSLEYAIRFNQVYLNDIIKRPFVSGAMVWNLADFNSETREETMPHINNKGLLTLGREPKDSYFLYQAYLLHKPFLKIASAAWKNRTGIAGSARLFATQPVQVMTNMKTAELFLNGKSLGMKEAVDHVCVWQVPFVNGLNKLRAAAENSTDELETDFKLQPFNLTDGLVPFDEVNILMGAKRFYINETTHQIWMPDQPYRKGGWGYIGGEAYKGTNNRMSYGSDKNILDTDQDPVYQTQQVGIKQFRFDVPDGEYELCLHFAELTGGAAKESLAYNLDNNHQKEEVKQRIFSVYINGETFLENLNLAADYGYTTAVKKKTRVTVSGGKGISLDFKAINGIPVLNALQLRKIY